MTPRKTYRHISRTLSFLLILTFSLEANYRGEIASFMLAFMLPICWSEWAMPFCIDAEFSTWGQARTAFSMQGRFPLLIALT